MFGQRYVLYLGLYLKVLQYIQCLSQYCLLSLLDRLLSIFNFNTKLIIYLFALAPHQVNIMKFKDNVSADIIRFVDEVKSQRV